MSYYREQLESFLKQLNVNCDTVIDIGGKQKQTKGRTQYWDVKNYFILDLPEHNLDEIFFCPHKGDIVFCLEVFEYLLNPTNAIINIRNLMKTNGVAYVSFPFIYPLHNEIEFDSLRYTKTAVNRLAKHANLSIEKIIERKAKTSTLTKYYAEDGMRAAKGQNHAVTGFLAIFKKESN